MQIITLLLSLVELLSKLLDQLTYIEGLKEAKKTSEFEYNDNFQKLDKALSNGDASGVAAISEQLRPVESNPDTGLKSPGAAPS